MEKAYREIDFNVWRFWGAWLLVLIITLIIINWGYTEYANGVLVDQFSFAIPDWVKIIILGATQSLVLKKYIQKFYQWIIASISIPIILFITQWIAFRPPNFDFNQIAIWFDNATDIKTYLLKSGILILIQAIAISIPHWLVLRKDFPRAKTWLFANPILFLGYEIFLFYDFYDYILQNPDIYIAAELTLNTILGWASGFTAAFFQGLFLIWILQYTYSAQTTNHEALSMEQTA